MMSEMEASIDLCDSYVDYYDELINDCLKISFEVGRTAHTTPHTRPPFYQYMPPHTHTHTHTLTHTHTHPSERPIRAFIPHAY